jgi:hypothetical protein
LLHTSVGRRSLWVQIRTGPCMWWETFECTREGGSSERLRDYSEDHGALVDAELGAA